MLSGGMYSDHKVQLCDEGGRVVVIVSLTGPLVVLDFDPTGVLVLKRNEVGIKFQERSHSLEADVSLGGFVVLRPTRPAEAYLWSLPPGVE
jgi:hypothetical protein